jgi:hemin uptake protein HemP
VEAPKDTKPQDARYLILDRAQPIPSERLFHLTAEVRISHQGEEYRLRRTRAGKLILTK